MRKHEAYTAGAGLGLMTAGLAALAISHGNMPWRHEAAKPAVPASSPSSRHAEDATAKLPPIVNTLINGDTQPVQSPENKAVDTGAYIVLTAGFIATSMAIVSALDVFPEDRKPVSVSPVDLPIQQGSPDRESIRVA